MVMKKRDEKLRVCAGTLVVFINFANCYVVTGVV